MQIRSEIVSKFSNAWKFLNKQQVRTYCEARRSFNVRKKGIQHMYVKEKPCVVCKI